MEEYGVNSYNDPIEVDVAFIKKWEIKPITLSCKNDKCLQKLSFKEELGDNDMIEVVCPKCKAKTRARYYSEGSYLWGHLEEDK